MYMYFTWLLDHVTLHMRFASVACVNSPSDGAVLKQKLASGGREPCLAYVFVANELRMFSTSLKGC